MTLKIEEGAELTKDEVVFGVCTEEDMRDNRRCSREADPHHIWSVNVLGTHFKNYTTQNMSELLCTINIFLITCRVTFFFSLRGACLDFIYLF